MYDSQGNKFSAEMIYNHLKQLSDFKQSDTFIGHLTADERQNWAPIYAKLSSSNKLSLKSDINNFEFVFF